MKIHSSRIVTNKVMRSICPYCMSKISKKELIKLRISKRCICKKCGREIDERFKIH